MFATTFLSTLIAIVGLALWTISGILNLYRLARYFQLEGYDSKRFWGVVSHQKRERNYIGLSIIATMALFVAAWFPLSVSDPDIELLQSLDLGASIFTLLVTSYDFIFRPRDREIKQKFTPTQRA